MRFATTAPLVIAAWFKSLPGRVVGCLMPQQALLFQLGKAQPPQAAGSALKAKLDHFSSQANTLKDLGSLVRLQGADAHFGENLQQPPAHRFDVVCQ
ncbi:hypothetical protein ADICEAN_03939 [Cesiribacter andamanensis AMV16]|uniref:Uncharacterized protein n=1 Tax=Cesiribacter andamanensis AMV16 TaxID=1279009 RepID=M7NR11_9BACT|nr:hypothetical protein ADICEAN_03939 [Cesiribacter andamanensis AMV16]